MEWQPIETAPKDGRNILGHDKYSNVTECIRWVKNKWVTTWDHEEFDDPTHWMPLPPPPSN